MKAVGLLLILGIVLLAYGGEAGQALGGFVLGAAVLVFLFMAFASG